MTAIQHLGIINIQDEYGTPMQLLNNAMDRYKIWPLIDVCTNHPNKKMPVFFTKDQDALKQNWNLDFFMNPPYSEVRRFMKYAYEQHQKWNVDALILTYSKTDTKWWHRYVEGKAEVHFIEGRIRFLNEAGHPTKHPAPYPSCWIIYRRKP